MTRERCSTPASLSSPTTFFMGPRCVSSQAKRNPDVDKVLESVLLAEFGVLDLEAEHGISLALTSEAHSVSAALS